MQKKRPEDSNTALLREQLLHSKLQNLNMQSNPGQMGYMSRFNSLASEPDQRKLSMQSINEVHEGTGPQMSGSDVVV